MDAMRRQGSGYGAYLCGGPDVSDQSVSRSDTFYGRLGSTTRDRENEFPPQRRISFLQDSTFRKVRIQLSFDEDAYPGGLDIDMFALIYDSSCNFVDCIFYKHPVDATGSFSLNRATNSLSIDLETVPDTCHSIILAAAVYTTGMSLTELEGGLIEISDGYVGPVRFSIPLQGLESTTGTSGSNATDTAGLLFFGLSEFGGRWRCRQLERFCKPELDSLMKLAKQEAQRIDDDFKHGNFKNLKTLDFAARTGEALPNASARMSRSGDAANSSHKVDELNNRVEALRALRHTQERGSEQRLEALEEGQKRLTRQMLNIEEKIDMVLEALK